MPQKELEEVPKEQTEDPKQEEVARSRSEEKHAKLSTILSSTHV